MADVQLIGVKKRFGAEEVIHGIDLHVAHGEFVVFVGPSGCGKSTLLRLICGLEPATEGEVRIGGRSMRGVPPSARGVAMVFQSYALYPHMTVADNMGFALRIGGISRRERGERVARAARTLQLDELLHRKPKELSGGQRQRVAIGRAIVREPEVFLFDEPLSNLDAELRVQMRLELAALHRALGATMVHVTHDQTEAMTLADRIVVMQSGHIEQVGTPMEVYEAPRNRFVAGFMGSPKMNFLKARVTARDGGAFRVAVPGMRPGELAFEAEDGAAPAGDELVLGIRPEDLGVGAAGAVAFDVEVGFVERLGGVSYLYAPDHPAGHVVARCDEGSARYARGGAAALAAPPDRFHLFDAAGAVVAARARAPAAA